MGERLRAGRAPGARQASFLTRVLPVTFQGVH